MLYWNGKVIRSNVKFEGGVESDWTKNTSHNVQSILVNDNKTYVIGLKYSGSTTGVGAYIFKTTFEI